MGIIEKQGIGWLEYKVASSHCLDPHFWENDKTITWDGNIFVFANKAGKKGELEGVVPVQIKSAKVNELSKGRIQHQFEVVDLKNYYQNGGVMLFVVELVDIDDPKIFCRSLYPSEIKEILQNNKADQKYKNVRLFELDVSSLIKLETACRDFLLHRKKQFSTIDYVLPLEEAKKITMYITTDENVEDYLLSHEVPFYGKRFEEDVECFVTNANIVSIGREVQEEVSIGTKVYYSEFEFIKKRDGQVYKFGSSISINMGTQKLHYEWGGTVDEQILAVEFLIHLFEVKEIVLGDSKPSKIVVEQINAEEKAIQRMKEKLQELNDIKGLFTFFHVDVNRLRISQMDRKSVSLLKFLIDKFIYSKEIANGPFSEGFNVIKLGNINLGAFVYKDVHRNSMVTYTIFDLAGKNQFAISVKDGPKIKVSPYTFCREEFLRVVDNFDTEIAFQDIVRFPYTDNYGIWVNLFGLEVIKTYDSTKEKVFLEMVSKLYEWLRDNDRESNIFQINYLQIVRRTREFSSAEKLSLYKMKEIEEDPRMLCGLNMLLENKSEVEFYFAQLSDEQKEEFQTYPIYTLASRQGLISDATD
jgi:hypothetical protein